VAQNVGPEFKVFFSSTRKKKEKKEEKDMRDMTDTCHLRTLPARKPSPHAVPQHCNRAMSHTKPLLFSSNIYRLGYPVIVTKI
jgi:hypothetical protein